jgi:hypothetical protein
MRNAEPEATYSPPAEGCFGPEERERAGDHQQAYKVQQQDYAGEDRVHGLAS